MMICTEGNFNDYRGYKGNFEYNKEDNLYHGKILGIDDFVNYAGYDLTELYHSFKKAIDDYIEFKKEVGKN